jgi:diaminohydroxyphosphoribosylaminopyrimidine deaminase/5-amino-6-(5-phosphoribosylamino)uracil reductase
MQDHAHWMRRAVRLAMNGRGRVEPNPMVGCVIVKDGRVIGEGYHEQFGGPHAEPNALAACIEAPEGATVFTTLEPCCHTNKKTPPCVPRLIEAKVGRVVIGCMDPNPQVNGQGATQLRAAGIEVVAPVAEAECRSLIASFTRRAMGLNPYVTLKWAETADGKVAGPGGRRMQISGPGSSKLVHRLRANSDAIVVGIGTVLSDDPLLTPRDVPLRHKPLRIVLDRGLRIPPQSQLVRTARGWPTVVIFNYFGTLPREHRALAGLGVQMHGHDVMGTTADEDLRIALEGVMRDELNLGEVLVEPGPTLARQFFDSRRVDRLWVIRSPVSVNDDTAPAAAKVPDWLVPTGTLGVGNDVLTEYRTPEWDDATETEFAPVASADFELASEAARVAQ